MKDGNDLVVIQGRLDLGEAADDRPGLAGDGQGVEHRAHQQPFRPDRQVRGNAGPRRLKARGQRPCADGLGERLPASR